MSSIIIPQRLPITEPRSEYINIFNNMGIVAWYNLKRDKGNKVFNLMNRSRDFTNLVLSPAMDTDTSGDGVVNDFTKANYGDITSACTLDANAQKIEVTGGTVVNRATVKTGYISVSPGENISVSVDTKKTGNVTSRVYLLYYLNGVFVSFVYSGDSTATDFATLSYLNNTVPASVNQVVIEFGARPVADGNTGSAWFKNARLVKAATLNHTGNTNATVSGATTQALGKYFDGVDDYTSIPNDEILNLNASNGLSVGVFINPNSTMASIGYVFCKNNSASADVCYAVQYDPVNERAILVGNGAGIMVTSNNGTVPKSKTTHVMFTWDGTTAKAYINGRFNNSGAYNTTLWNMPNIFIGKRGGGTLYKGVIGDVLLANKALTAAQVRQVGKMLGWQYPGLAMVQ